MKSVFNELVYKIRQGLSLCLNAWLVTLVAFENTLSFVLSLFFSSQLDDQFIIDGLSMLLKQMNYRHLKDFPKGLSCQTNSFWNEGLQISSLMRGVSAISETCSMTICKYQSHETHYLSAKVI